MTSPNTGTTGRSSTAIRENGRRPNYSPARRLSTETKAAFKTTEFWVYVAMVIAVLIASLAVGSDSHAVNGGKAGDYFRADKAWLYITIMTVGYMFSRGLAKSGSRDFYDDSNDSPGH